MILADSFPTHQAGEIKYRCGRVFPFGATIVEGGVNFSIFSKEATRCTLVLFHEGEKLPFIEIPFPEEFRIGGVFAMMVFGINEETTEYGYRFEGPYDAKAGLLFDAEKILLDPYAKSVSGRDVWGEKPRDRGSYQHRGRIVREDYDWNGDRPLRIPANDLLIYELHVRSFTRDPSSGVHYPGTFAGLAEKIPYLKKLGINCVELMPVFSFDELENPMVAEGERLLNYWGYSTVCFFAPKAGYADSGRYGLEVDELKAMIARFHAAGIAVFLDVVFNHTAEGGDNGPYISYRGIDNRTYYLLTPDGKNVNFSGCGNTLNCNNAVVRNCILDCLRYWVSSCHIDGFRFDLASILSRDEHGMPMISPPVLESLAQDAVLSDTTLIAEAWDAGGLYQVGNFPSWNRWSEWNGRYRDCVRRFVKGEADALPELVRRIGGSEDMYCGRGPSASVNFVTCHDGFTLRDLVSYNEKHNEKNGEDSRDGSNDNLSWNCGAEGDTENAEVKALRIRQMKNFMTILLTSRGIPMILSGDEMGNTQYGNNNAYCHDNAVSWINWDLQGEYGEYQQYVEKLIAFRNAHPVLRSAAYDTSANGTGYPELSFHSAEPWNFDRNGNSLSFAYMYVEDHVKYGTEEDCFIYILINAHWEEHRFHFPIIPAGKRWKVIVGSGEAVSGSQQEEALEKGWISLGPRSSAILVGSS